MSPPPPLSPSSDMASLTLAASFLLAAHLTYRCWTPPNPTPTPNPSNSPTVALPRDAVGPGTSAIRVRRFIPLFLWTHHILLTLLSPSLAPTILCPNPHNLSRSLLTWSPYTTAIVSLIITVAPIRLLAFQQLGPNFTFRLARPAALVTTGLYAYVQHPSYLPNWVVLMANVALLLRLDGVLGCVLPGEVVRWGMGVGGLGPWPAVLVGVGVLGLWAIWIRVRDEEAMLEREFGQKWREWHGRTKRFVPGVF